MTIQETAAAAKADGLSYGQYVDAHKNDAPAESPAETTPRSTPMRLAKAILLMAIISVWGTLSRRVPSIGLDVSHETPKSKCV